MLLLSVQGAKFQKHQSILCTCTAFSRTNSKKTDHCCAPAQCSGGTNSKNIDHFCAPVKFSVGQIPPKRSITTVLLLSVQWDKVQEYRPLLCSCSVFGGTNSSKKTDHYCAPAQLSVGLIPRKPVTFVHLLSVQWDKFLQEDRSLLFSYSAFSQTNSKNTDHLCALAQCSVGQIPPRRPITTVLLLSVQSVKFQEHRSLLCSCSAFSGTNSHKTGHCCVHAQRSVGQIPRRPVTAVLLLSVQWDKFQEFRSLLWSCSSFSETNSKKTGHCCTPAQRSVGQIPRRAVTVVLLLSVQSDTFQEDRSLLCSCPAFSRTNSKKTDHCCAPAQRSVGQIPRRPVTVVLLFSVQWDKFQEDWSLLCSCTAFSRTKSKKTDHCCALARSSVGQIPRRPSPKIAKRAVTAVPLLNDQWDDFQKEWSLLCFCSAVSETNSTKSDHCCTPTQCSVGHIPKRPVTDVLLFSGQWDKFQEDRSKLCSCSAFRGTKPKKPVADVLPFSVQWGKFQEVRSLLCFLFSVQRDKFQ